MTQKQQTAAFARELNNLIERTRKEFDLSYAATIGVLTLATQRLATEAERTHCEDCGKDIDDIPHTTTEDGISLCNECAENLG